MTAFSQVKNNQTSKHKFLFTLSASQAKTRLEKFRLYTLQLEQKFTADKQSVEDSYQEAISQVSDDEATDAHEYFGEMYQEIDSVNVPLFRHSTVVTLYTFLESSMNKLCRHLYRLKQYSVELSDLKGDGISRAKLYLEKLANVDFDKLNGDWSKLSSLNAIRNCLVHAEGNINGVRSPTKLTKIVENTDGIYANYNSEIVIEREYVENCIDTIESFLIQLYELLKEMEK